MEAPTQPQDEDAPPAVADDVSHPLDPRWITYRRRAGWLASLVFAALVTGLAAAGVMLAQLPVTPLVVVAAIAAIIHAGLSQWWPGVAYGYASYRLNGRTLEIRKGVLWRGVIAVPRSRIQHSDVSQGPLERLHGLGTLSVYTAGTRHALVRLPGLDHQRALAMREHLMQADDDDVI